LLDSLLQEIFVHYVIVSIVDYLENNNV